MARRHTVGFLQSVNQWTKKAEDRSTEAFQEGVKDLYDALYSATPYDQGDLRNSLQISVNGQSMSSDVTGQTHTTGAGGRNYAIADSLKLGDRVLFSYGRLYWRILEFGFSGVDSLGRFRVVAPRFYIRSTLSKWRSIIRAAATRLRG